MCSWRQEYTKTDVLKIELRSCEILPLSIPSLLLLLLVRARFLLRFVFLSRPGRATIPLLDIEQIPLTGASIHSGRETQLMGRDLSTSISRPKRICHAVGFNTSERNNFHLFAVRTYRTAKPRVSLPPRYPPPGGEEPFARNTKGRETVAKRINFSFMRQVSHHATFFLFPRFLLPPLQHPPLCFYFQSPLTTHFSTLVESRNPTHLSQLSPRLGERFSQVSRSRMRVRFFHKIPAARVDS